MRTGTISTTMGGVSSNLGGFLDYSYNAFSGQNGGIGSTVGDFNDGFSTTNQGSSNNWIADLIKQGIGLTSQILAGKQGTVQTSNGIPVYQQNQQNNQTQGGGIGTNPSGGVGQQAVGTATNFVDSIAASFGISTTTLALLTAGGVFLFLREPKRR